MIHSVNNCGYQLCSEGNSTAGGVGEEQNICTGSLSGSVSAPMMEHLPASQSQFSSISSKQI